MIGKMPLHANPVAQNRTAGVRTGWVNRNYAYRLLLFAKMYCELINQRTFAGAR